MAEPLTDKDLALFRRNCESIDSLGWAAVPEIVYQLLATIDAYDARIAELVTALRIVEDELRAINPGDFTSDGKCRFRAIRTCERILPLAAPVSCDDDHGGAGFGCTVRGCDCDDYEAPPAQEGCA